MCQALLEIMEPEIKEQAEQRSMFSRGGGRRKTAGTVKDSAFSPSIIILRFI